MKQESESDGNKRAVNRRVQQIITEMHRVRQQFQEEREVGDVSDSLHLRFQTALVSCHDALRPFRNRAKSKWEDATEWDEYGLEVLPFAVKARPVETSSSAGMGRFKRQVEHQPRLLDEGHLLQISYDIDEIAEGIGFEPAPDIAPGDVEGGQI